MLLTLGALITLAFVACDRDTPTQPVVRAGKATDDCVLCDLFGAFNEAQEEEDETPAEEAETDSTASEGGPDLIVQPPSASAVVLTPGDAFTLHVTVHNQGDQQAAATMLHYYRSNNTTISASDTEVGTGAVDALDASATSAESIELTASVGVERYYGACVASVRGESNTDNNCSSAVKITMSGQEQEETEDEEADETPAEESETDSTSREGGPDPYIRIRTDGSLSEVGLKSVKEAVAEWNAVIIAGPMDSLVIEFNAIPSHEYVAFVDPKGSAEGLEFKRVEGDRVIARCLAKALSIDAFNEAYHPEINRIRQKNIWAHEIGHCLGIGLGSRWDRQVEYQSGYTLHIDTDEKISSDKTYPHFVGPSAQAEFLRLSEGGWDIDKWPHVPLDWSKYYGSDHRHLATPLFWRNYMAYSTWGNEYRKAVASLDAAFLEDLGYTVRWDQVQDTEMTGGYRHIYIRRDSSKRLVIEREKVYDAVETLLFPAHPLVFIETDWSPMAYYPAVIWDKYSQGLTSAVYVDDPTIDWDNVTDWWYGENDYFGYKDHYEKRNRIGPEHFGSGKANVAAHRWYDIRY